MSHRIKKIVLIVLGVSLLGWWSFAAFKYSDDILGIFEKWYSNSYTLEEVNEKILKFQIDSVNEFENAYNQAIVKSQSQRVSWDFGVSIEANSSFGWWNGSMNLDNIDIQYSQTWLDLLIQWVTIAGEAQIFWELNSWNISLWDGHIIANESGSYIVADKLKINTQQLGTEIIPEEIIITLNKLWESGKYIDLSENFFYDIMQKQIQSQSSEVEEFYKDALDFLKEKPVFVAYKQEDTRYHIMPSRELCNFTLNVYTKAQWLESGECNEEQYQLLSDYYTSSDYHEIKNFYIQLNTTKLNYVFDSVFMTPETEDTSIVVEVWTSATMSLTQTESSNTYMRIKNDSVTGSWFLLEQTWENINGYMDFNIPDYNFGSNMTLSGTTDNVEIIWNYTFVAPEDISDRDLRVFQWVKLSWDMSASLGLEKYNIEIKNNFSQDDFGVNWEAKIDINGGLVWDTNIWEMLISWELKMWENASPISWDITAKWDTQMNETLAKWDISYELNIPNIASGKYELSYDFTISDIIESSFETPANIIPQKNLNSLIMINKNRIEKEKAEKLKELIEKIQSWIDVNVTKELWLDWWSIARYKIDAMNSKVMSDLRTLATSIEIDITTTWNTTNTYVDSISAIQTNSGTLHTGEIDFKTIGQNKNDFNSPFWIPYEIRSFSIKIDNETYAFYQIHGYTIKNKKFVDNFMWNYIQINPDMPKSLFDIEIK